MKYIFGVFLIIFLSFNCFTQVVTQRIVTIKPGFQFYCTECDEDDYGHWSGKYLNGFATGAGIRKIFTSDSILYSTYTGNLLNGKRIGKGKISYAGWGTYDGNWQNDMQNGLGTILYEDSSKFVGKFKNNVYVEGIYYSKNGQIIQKGIFQNEELYNGVSYNEDGTLNYDIKSGLKIYPETNEEKEVRIRADKIKINSNKSQWKMGNKLCLEIDGKTIIGVINQWNEDKSMAQIKIISETMGKFEGEDIESGSVIWIELSGKNWHICLADEVETGLSLQEENLKSHKKETTNSLTFEMKNTAAKYAKLAGKQIMYKCRIYGSPSNLNTDIGEIKYFEAGGGGFMVDIVYKWNDEDMTKRSVVEMYKGAITFDQYGCNGAFLITAKNNSGSFWSTGKQGACYYDIPAKDKDKYNKFISGANWFMNVECVE